MYAQSACVVAHIYQQLHADRLLVQTGHLYKGSLCHPTCTDTGCASTCRAGSTEAVRDVCRHPEHCKQLPAAQQDVPFSTGLHPAPAHLHGQAQDPSTREGAPKGKSLAGRVHPTQTAGAQQ